MRREAQGFYEHSLLRHQSCSEFPYTLAKLAINFITVSATSPWIE